MCKISYEYLRNLWLKQNESFEKCTSDLIRGAYVLRDRFAELIKAPEKWKDPVTPEVHRYIEIISLKTKENPLENFGKWCVVTHPTFLCFTLGIFNSCLLVL